MGRGLLLCEHIKSFLDEENHNSLVSLKTLYFIHIGHTHNHDSSFRTHNITHNHDSSFTIYCHPTKNFRFTGIFTKNTKEMKSSFGFSNNVNANKSAQKHWNWYIAKCKWCSESPKTLIIQNNNLPHAMLSIITKVIPVN